MVFAEAAQVVSLILGGFLKINFFYFQFSVSQFT